MVERSRSEPHRSLRIVTTHEQRGPLVIGSAATAGVVIGVPACLGGSEGNRGFALLRIGVQAQRTPCGAALEPRRAGVARHRSGGTQDDDLRTGKRAEGVRDGKRAGMGRDCRVPLRRPDGRVVRKPEGVEGRDDHDGTATGHGERAQADADGSRYDESASFAHERSTSRVSVAAAPGAFTAVTDGNSSCDQHSVACAGFYADGEAHAPLKHGRRLFPSVVP